MYIGSYIHDVEESRLFLMACESVVVVVVKVVEAERTWWT